MLFESRGAVRLHYRLIYIRAKEASCRQTLVYFEVHILRAYHFQSWNIEGIVWIYILLVAFAGLVEFSLFRNCLSHIMSCNCCGRHGWLTRICWRILTYADVCRHGWLTLSISCQLRPWGPKHISERISRIRYDWYRESGNLSLSNLPLSRYQTPPKGLGGG